MAFCVKCGSSVSDSDQFCSKCGARQPVFGSRTAPGDLLGGVSSRTAAMLCYIPMVGWIAAIVVLASARFRQDARVRFHAFQGLYLFVAWLMVEWVVSPALYFSTGGGFPFHRLFTSLLQLVIFAAWVFMIIKASHGEQYKLPIIGELAERSVSEQRS